MKAKRMLPIVVAGALALASMAAPAMAAGTGIGALRGKVGIWFFYMTTCPYCAKEEPILYKIEKEYGIAVLPISLNGGPTPNKLFKHYAINRGQATRLSVKVTPTLFLVNPNSKQVVELSQGLMPARRLIPRIVAAATNAGWLNDAGKHVTGVDASVLHGKATSVGSTAGVAKASRRALDAPVYFQLGSEQ